MRRASHKLGPPEVFCGRGGFYSLFFGERETFFGGPVLHSQANTRPAARPPSGQSDIPRKGNLGGGTTWPASPFYFYPPLSTEIHYIWTAIARINSRSFCIVRAYDWLGITLR